MTTQIITQSEITERAVSSLPTRPTAPASFGGKGYTATDMKAAFDRLPRFIAERLNSLIEDTAALEADLAAHGIDAGTPAERASEEVSV